MTEENKKLIEEFGGQYKASTRYVYKRQVADFVEKFGDVSKGTVIDFLESISSSGLTKSSLELANHAIREWAKFLSKKQNKDLDGFFEDYDFKRRYRNIKNDCVKHSKRKPMPTYVTEEEFNRIWDACKVLNSEFATYRNRIVIALGAYAGMRRNEIAKAKWNHISDDWKKMTIYGKAGKSEVLMNQRIIPFLKKLKEIHKRWHIESDYIVVSTSNRNFGEQLSGNAINKIVNDVSLKANKKRITAHDLRHYFANSLFDMGIRLQDIQKQMRHKSEKSVIDYLVTHGSNRLEETQWAN